LQRIGRMRRSAEDEHERERQAVDSKLFQSRKHLICARPFA
jgi:hypothetical protein